MGGALTFFPLLALFCQIYSNSLQNTRTSRKELKILLWRLLSLVFRSCHIYSRGQNSERSNTESIRKRNVSKFGFQSLVFKWSTIRKPNIQMPALAQVVLKKGFFFLKRPRQAPIRNPNEIVRILNGLKNKMATLAQTVLYSNLFFSLCMKWSRLAQFGFQMVGTRTERL